MKLDMLKLRMIGIVIIVAVESSCSGGGGSDDPLASATLSPIINGPWTGTINSATDGRGALAIDFVITNEVSISGTWAADFDDRTSFLHRTGFVGGAFIPKNRPFFQFSLFTDSTLSCQLNTFDAIVFGDVMSGSYGSVDCPEESGTYRLVRD